MSLKDGIVFWTIIPNYETKQELAFIVVYEILIKETLGSKSILGTFEHY